LEEFGDGGVIGPGIGAPYLDNSGVVTCNTILPDHASDFGGEIGKELEFGERSILVLGYTFC